MVKKGVATSVILHVNLDNNIMLKIPSYLHPKSWQRTSVISTDAIAYRLCISGVWCYIVGIQYGHHFIPASHGGR